MVITAKTNKTFSSDLCQKWAEENNIPISKDSWFNQSYLDGKKILVDKK